jgi:hypothetical protein
VPKVWVLDANVLFSDWARALLYCLAKHHQAQLCWSALIEDEVFRNLVRLNRLSALDASIQRSGIATLLNGTILPDANPAYFADLKSVDDKDRHVAALALDLHHRHQSMIGLITWNSKDFPRKPLMKKGIVRYSPDDLMFGLVPKSEEGLQLLHQSLNEVLAFKQKLPLQEPTEYLNRARPWPDSPESWKDFLSRNRMHRVSKLIFKD